jgi:hypothetical protein
MTTSATTAMTMISEMPMSNIALCHKYPDESAA